MVSGLNRLKDTAIKYKKKKNLSTDIPNCLVITSSELENTCFNTFDLTTSKFVGRFDNTKPLLLDTYNGRNSSFIENSNLFPNKMTNLHQRVVRMALFNYKPYAIWVEVVRS